ncbi:unnamed protein product [Eruca vesicaria subsp. sativa]|uniref:Uncharacterized protein n=1 Tax=Eruca vesicaria subsp. sativa TaxID=29727 RepID=A0ABC8L8R2_ERUVS|nr:unnamed protein product [Eruca vesicaria subsp. sativa]
MCSNISSGSYGGDRDLQQDDYFGSCPKKQKQDKVRRRGPGVAELEKIRLEEENKSASSLPRTDNTLIPLPPQLPSPSFYTTNPIFRPPATAMPPNFALPLSSYFSNGSFPMPVFQKEQHYPNHHTMNLANPSQGPGRLCQFIEPPSNQRSCVHNVSQFLQKEEKASKRPWHFLTDTTTKASVEQPISRMLRESKHNRSLDMRLISPNQYSGTTICNPISIESPTSITRDFNVQYEQQQQQQQEQDFDENMQRRSMKTFYSFIPSNDQSNVDREQLAIEPHESAADHGIDLSLKL